MRSLPSHKNLVKLKEVFEGENTFYLVMDISEGNSLYDEIKKL
jgi:serine/threonine protein kinase